MTPDHTKLARVLAALDQYRLPSGHVLPCAADAARVIRELAADFARYAPNGHSKRCHDRVDGRCECGLDAAREKWRLEP